MFREKNDILAVRRHNQVSILRMLLDIKNISRAEVAKLVKLSKPTVNEHIDILIKEGIIKETGHGNSNAKGGRKPIMLSPNDSYKYIVAVDMNAMHPIIAIGNLSGYPVDKTRIGVGESVVFTKELIREYIDNILTKNKIKSEQVGVIVVSVPGIVDNGKHILFFNKQHEKLHNLNLSSYLEKIYNIQTIVKNDANMAAIAEAKFLKNEKIDNIYYLSCGNGLGSGIMINGRLYEGCNNSAGEIGFYIDHNSGKVLEELVTIQPLIERVARENSPFLKDKIICFETIVEAYKNNDTIVVSIIREIGYLLGICLNNVVSLIDIQTIIIGGDYIVFQDILIEEISKVMNNSALFTKCEIIPASLEYAGGVIGCFAVGIEFIINNLET